MKKPLAAAVGLLASMLATSALATTYSLSPTTLQDGTVVSGTFDYDSVAMGAFTAVNMTATGPSAGTFNFPGLRSAATAVFAQQSASISTGARVFYLDTASLQPTGVFMNVRVGIGNCSNVPASPGGKCFNSSIGSNNFDSAAGNYVGTVQVGVPTPVPTLSEWAMILLGLTLSGGAALALQQRRVGIG